MPTRWKIYYRFKINYDGRRNCNTFRESVVDIRELFFIVFIVVFRLIFFYCSGHVIRLSDFAKIIEIICLGKVKRKIYCKQLLDTITTTTRFLAFHADRINQFCLGPLV